MASIVPPPDTPALTPAPAASTSQPAPTLALAPAPANDQDDATVVEITDPQSGRIFYADILTGDCSWLPPSPGKVKPKDPFGTEWWELFDDNNNLPYYYNTKTRLTEWHRPTKGTIIPLTAIQNSAIGKQVSGAFKTSAAQDNQPTNAATASAEREGPSAAKANHGIYNARLLSTSKASTLKPLHVPSLPALKTNDVALRAKTLGISEPTANPDAAARMAPILQPYTSMPSSALPSPTTAQTSITDTLSPFSPNIPMPWSSFTSSNLGIQSALHSLPHTPQNSQPAPPAPPPPAPSPPPPLAKVLPQDLKAHINQFKIEGFAKKYFAEQRQGLFRRKVPMNRMLKYQKDPIKAPLMVLSKSFHKEALKTFRYIQKIMSLGPQSCLQEIQQVLDRGIMVGGLRDEIYVQICKQMTDNPSSESTVKGWMLLCAVTIAFPPSKNFEDYMRSFIETSFNSNIDRVDTLARHCYKKYLRICKTGPRGKTPTITEIERAQEAPFVTAVFGETLEEIMRAQEEHFPDLPIPRVLPFLADAILSLNGCKTEGIFRVPGDADAVTDLKCRLEKGNYDVAGITDANVPGSLLKLWLRELAEPLIPSEYYQACVEVGAEENKPDAGSRAVTIVDSLPEYNKRVVYYVIRFLRAVAEPQNHSITKMTVQNLAMVFAPNFLRCPSEDPTVIFNSTKYEQGFLRTLMHSELPR
ncbi:hypothetical protein SeMB42_g05768 [Synchytrium endobioticum]|uniref:Rho-GAP domain-containing protein n=1 Tax=Synchytrium endobioticum TaxID=286115 RepID=A0A507CPG6_9FUNG|nr:hypothetical protein SeMB42_g05768 [Synchytrium endobioticum]